MSRRYPLAPLVQMMGVTLSEAGRQLNLNGVYYRRYCDEGMPRDTADRMAVKAGLHPYNVWPDMVDHDLIDAEQAEEERRERRRAASRKSWHKQWAAMTPEQQEAKREYTRRYHAEARKAGRANSRRYYAANRARILARQREYDARKRQERKAA